MTLAELKKLFGEQPDLFKEVLGHIATTEEGKEMLNNFAKVEVDKAKGELTSEIYNNIDKDVKEVLGVDKPANQKTFDHVKNLLTELKGLKEAKGGDGKDDPKSAEKITALENKLAEIKKANWEGKYNTLVTESATKVQELTNKITGLETGNTETLVNIELATGLSNLKFNPNIPKEATDAMTEAVKAKVLKSAKVVDGKVVYHKEDGTPYLNEVFQPITAEGIYKAELKSILVSTASGGGGAEAGEKGKIVTKGEGDTAKKTVVLDASKFNTKLGFANHIEEVLLENGVERNSADWHSITAEARTEYGVDKMERT